MPGPTVIATAKASVRANAETTGVTVTHGFTLQADDVLYAILGQGDDPGTAWSSSGWSEILAKLGTTTGNDRASGAMRKVITTPGSEPSSYTFTLTGNNATDNLVAFLLQVRGADTSTPEDATPARTVSPNDFTPAGQDITTNTDDALLITAHLGVGSSTQYSGGDTRTPGAPAGFTLLDHVVYADGTNSFSLFLEVAKLENSGAAGSKTVGSWTGSADDSSSEYDVITIAVKPAASSAQTLNGSPAADGWAATSGSLTPGGATLAGSPATDLWAATSGDLTPYLSESFDGSMGSVWTSSADVAFTGGRLVGTMTGTGIAHLTSDWRATVGYSLMTGQRWCWRLVQAPSIPHNDAQSAIYFKGTGATGDEFLAGLKYVTSAWYLSLWGWEAGVGNWTNQASIPYDPDVHRWIGIRYRPGTDDLVLETSADGENWTVRYTAARGTMEPWGLSVAVWVVYDWTAAGGTGVFDSLNLPAALQTLAGSPAADAWAATDGEVVASGGAQTLNGSPAVDAWAATQGTLQPGGIALAGSPAADAWAATQGAAAPGGAALTGSPAADAWAATSGALQPGGAELAGSPAADPWAATTGALQGGAAVLAGSPAADGWAATTGALEPGAVQLAGSPAADGWVATSGALAPGGAFLPGSPSSSPWAATTGLLQPGGVELAGSPAIDLWAATLGSVTGLGAPQTLSGEAAAAPWTATAGILAPGGVVLDGSPAADGWAATAGALGATTTLAGSPAAAPWAATQGVASPGGALLAGSPSSSLWQATTGALLGPGTLAGSPSSSPWTATTGTLSSSTHLAGAPAAALWAATSGLLLPGPATLAGEPAAASWSATLGSLSAQVFTSQLSCTLQPLEQLAVGTFRLVVELSAAAAAAPVGGTAAVRVQLSTGAFRLVQTLTATPGG